MRVSARHMVAAATLVLLAGCHGSAAVAPLWGKVDTDGVVRYVSLEGGFFSLESAQAKYDPMNLPVAYHQDGLPVHFAGVVRTEMVSIHCTPLFWSLPTSGGAEVRTRLAPCGP